MMACTGEQNRGMRLQCLLMSLLCTELSCTRRSDGCCLEVSLPTQNQRSSLCCGWNGLHRPTTRLVMMWAAHIDTAQAQEEGWHHAKAHAKLALALSR